MSNNLSKNQLKEHIREIVLNEIKILVGKDDTFPVSYRRGHPTVLETIMKQDSLNEGLIRTYPSEWVRKYIQRYYNSDFIKGGWEKKYRQFWFVLKQDSASIETLKNKMETFGYYCSVEDKTEDNTGIFLQFEPKFDTFYLAQDFPAWNNPTVNTFFHVTPYNHTEKIEKNGLVPKSKNNYLKYPDRIFLVADQRDAYTMAELLYEEDNNPNNTGDYTMFGISLDGLKDMKFYPDRNVEDFDAFFTYENIPPKNLHNLGTIQCQNILIIRQKTNYLQ